MLIASVTEDHPQPLPAAAATVTPLRAPDATVRLVDVEPDLAADLTGEDLVLARRHLVVPALDLPIGVWAPGPQVAGSLAVLVVGGMVLRDGVTLDRPDVELFGPGDYLDPRLFADASSEWRVIEPVRLALLDERVVLVARRCPQLISRLMQRLFDGHHEHHRLAAIRALPRVEERVIGLLTHQASRWGRVTPEGITLALPVTHELLGRLVGARRPTISLALAELRDQGRLRRLPDGRWLLP
jgi:CRP/FNR family cyclic AMP-dependent transcriptional regulator